MAASPRSIKGENEMRYQAVKVQHKFIGTGKCIVLYIRYSSTGQNEQTVEGQIRVCKEWAEANGYTVVGIYIDKAKSAWSDSDKRVEFNKMMKDAGSGKFQYILVYKFDRFARNRLDSQMHKQRLKKEFGIRVLSATEPVSDDEGGEIYEMFLEWNDEKYSQRLSKIVRERLGIAMENGTFCGGHLIYGYRIRKEPIPNKKDSFTKYVEIDEEQAEIIRFIFRQYAKGVAKDNIAKALNEQGKRYNGKLFKGRTFDKWLANEKYTGTFSFGERVCNNMYPQIIDRTTFDKAQQLLQKNKYFAKSNTARELFLLNSKAYCTHSGTGMIADGGTSHTGATYKYYVCKTARKGLCIKTREEKNHLEEWVTEETVIFFKDKKQVNKAADDVIAYYDNKTNTSAFKALETQIANIKRDMENTTTAYIQAVATKNDLFIKSCETRMSEQAQLIEDLQKQLSKLNAERGMKITKQEILDFIAEFTDGDTKDKAFQKRIIDNLVNCIYISNGRGSIYFTIKGSTNELPIITKVDNDLVIQKATVTEGSDSVAIGGE